MLLLLGVYLIPLIIFWTLYFGDKILHGSPCGTGGGDAPMIEALLMISSFIPFVNFLTAITMIKATIEYCKR